MKLRQGFFILASLLLISDYCLAQSISLTGPTAPVTVREGDDFATTELSNPWDFNERRDIGWEENFVGTSVAVSGGIWSATNAVAGGFVFPLFPDFKGTIHNEPLPGDRSLPKLGITHRIDASKYTQLCYRSRVSAPSIFAIYWANDDTQPEYWPDGSNKGASFDGFYPLSQAGIPVSGWQIRCFDMSNLNSTFEQKGGSWSGNIHALRIDPSVGGGVGTTTDFDWIRLVDPNSAPTINVTWSSSGISGLQIRTIYVDTDNSGFDGTPIGRTTSGDPGSYAIKTASLPPGNYYFYVTAQAASNGSLVGPTYTSGYSARVTVDQAPIATVLSPSMTSGTEFAANEVGNAWDMDSETDVPNLDRAHYPDILRQFSNESFAADGAAEDAGKVFQASANPPLAGATESDDQVWLNVPTGRPIDAGKYRYIAYRMAADDTNFPTIVDKVRDGWVTRAIWWNNDVIADGGDPGGHVLYEGWHTYAYDLWAQSLQRGIPWTSNSKLRHLRIDPLETNIPTWFYLDWVRLFAENREVDDQFTISWNLQDVDSSNFTVSLYYDNTAAGYDGSLITTLNNVTAGNNSYVWNTSGLPSGGRYWIYMVVSDGVNTVRHYSPVHVMIGDYAPPPVARSGRAEFDYDGDAKSDLAVLLPGGTTSSAPAVSSRKKKPKPPKKPKVVVNKIATSAIALTKNGATVTNSHDPAAKLIGLDLNGDHWADLITVINNAPAGLMTWTGTLSRTAFNYTRVFGLAGDTPVKGDFNGNLTDEIAVYRAGSWYRMDEENGVSLVQWGLAGDIPVPADYDGDGITDYAVWRPSNGTWYVVNSGYALGYANGEQVQVFQWGLPGDQPVQGDYDGDGRDDCAVWRPGDGMWYIRYARDGSTAAVQWGAGFFGDVPFRGLDMNGDGKSDFVVYRPGASAFFFNYGNGQTGAKVLGSSSHVLPVNH